MFWLLILKIFLEPFVLAIPQALSLTNYHPSLSKRVQRYGFISYFQTYRSFFLFIDKET